MVDSTEGTFAFQPLREEDLPFLLEVRNDCRDMLHDERAFSLQECRAWFRSQHPDFFIVRHNGDRVGYFRLSNRDAADRSIYVGADLHRQFRGHGLARPAYEAFFAMLRDQQQIAVAKLEVLSHNTVALGLYQKLGFVEVGRKTAFATRNGESVDSIVMRRTL